MCGVPSIATRCTSNWSIFCSVGGNGAELGLEWLKEDLGKGDTEAGGWH